MTYSKDSDEGILSELSLKGPSQVGIIGPMLPGFAQILTPAALQFVAIITDEFSGKLKTLLANRSKISERVRSGVLPNFLPETEGIRTGTWKVETIPQDLQLRRVEITGPVDRKMMINALNSGADVFMADFEDSHSPTWEGTIQGQINLRDAIQETIEYTGPEGKKYQLNDKISTLCVRPRGLHLLEKHVLIDSAPVPAPFFDFALYIYHNAKRLVEKGSGPYYYLPKLENHMEARLWNDIFRTAEDNLQLPRGTIKCSVLIENILAAFEMEEILYELREHITALNFGRWDYIFSYIKKLGYSPEFLLPDRALLAMSTHFLESSSMLLVQTAHKRGAYAIGGMAAQVPIKNNPEAQAKAMEKVATDKRREAEQGYDGAWVAHPGLVPLVMEIFERVTEKNNQLHIKHEGLEITAVDLLTPPQGSISEEDMRANISVSLRYLESWLGGSGCVAINNLMEDTATVEISRALIWEWIRHEAKLSNGRWVTPELFRAILKDELATAGLRTGLGNHHIGLELASSILERVVTSSDFVDFLPLVAYDYLR